MKLVGKHHFWHFSRDIDAESNMKNRSKRMQTLPRSLCPLHDKQRKRKRASYRGDKCDRVVLQKEEMRKKTCSRRRTDFCFPSLKNSHLYIYLS